MSTQYLAVEAPDTSRKRSRRQIDFLNNGQVATTEEMQEFEDFKQSKIEQVFEPIKTAEKTR